MASLYEALVDATTTRLYDRCVALSEVHQAAVVTPIWQPQLDAQAAAFLRISHRTNPELRTVFLAPRTLDLGYYREVFPTTEVLTFDSCHFTSVAAYSAWMTTPEPYQALSDVNWMVLCQTDAVLVRPLHDVLVNVDRQAHPYDYLGACWRPPVRVLALGDRLVVDSPTGHPRGPWYARLFGRRLQVGNGGLSIRRIERFHAVAAAITQQTPRRIIEHCYEDVIFCTYGPAQGLRIATPAQARALFAETEVVDRSTLPEMYGFHALPRWNPALAELLLRQYADE